eukprot:6579355-Prymnesium_polylepis.1
MSLWVYCGAGHRPKSGFTVWLHRQRRARHTGCHKKRARHARPQAPQPRMVATPAAQAARASLALTAAAAAAGALAGRARPADRRLP